MTMMQGSKTAVWLSMIALGGSAMMLGCSKDSPAPAPATTTAAAPAASSAAATDKKKHEGKKGAEKAKKSLPEAKQHPVPKDWIELEDKVRGFSFSVPAGSTGGGQDKNGVGVFMGVLPKPNDHVLTCVVAYKDAKKTLDDLGKDVDDMIGKVFEEKDVKVVKTDDITADYRLLELTSADAKDGTKSHWKALLATDVTDNYEMIVGTPEAEFKANEPTMDEIWGSFDMYSGGASGESGSDELAPSVSPIAEICGPRHSEGRRSRLLARRSLLGTWFCFRAGNRGFPAGSLREDGRSERWNRSTAQNRFFRAHALRRSSLLRSSPKLAFKPRARVIAFGAWPVTRFVVL